MRKTALLAALLAALPAFAQKATSKGPGIDRGRYIATIGGCNDCHTAGYAPSGGKVPESEWLKGDALGWNGPWGTTYAPNLRIYFQGISEAEWLKKARTLTTRPPMPWFNVQKMTDRDLRGLYRYVRSLQPVGEPAPAYQPPEQAPAGAAVRFPAPPK